MLCGKYRMLSFALCLVLLGTMITSCRRAEVVEDSDPFYSDPIESCYARKTDIAGEDKVRKLVDRLPFIKDLFFDGLTISTHSSKTLSLQYSYLEYLIDTTSLFYNSCVLFSLISDLDEVDFVIEGDTYTYQRAQVDHAFGKDVRLFAADLEQFRAYYTELARLNAVHAYDGSLVYFIPAGCQVAMGKGTMYTDTFDQTIKLQGANMYDIAKQYNLDLNLYYGKEFRVLLMDVETIPGPNKPSVVTPYVFIVYDKNVMFVKTLNTKELQDKANTIIAESLPHAKKK